MKPLGTMFKYLRRHICRFLKLDQIDQTGSSVDILYASEYNIDGLFRGICNTPIQMRSEYYVKELTWYKQSNGPQHEFVVAKLTNSTYLKVDRKPSADENSSTSASSSLDNIPEDEEVLIHVFPRNSRNFKKIVTSKYVTTVCKYTFTTFPVLEFARLLVTISNSEHDYTINGTMSYGYASRIVALSTQIFSGVEVKKTNGLRGRKRGIMKFNDDAGLDDIKGRYIQARDADPEPIGPNIRIVIQEANRKADERRRLREEADCKADEERRLREEAERKAEERRVLREEAERKAEERQRLREEAERKADEERLLREKAELELERYKALAGHREGH